MPWLSKPAAESLELVIVAAPSRRCVTRTSYPDPLRVARRLSGLEVTELLLLT